MNRQHLHHLIAIGIAVIVTGAAWAIVVPPFEGLDESHYYQVVLERSKGRTISQHSLFFRMAAPLLGLADGRDVPYHIHLNPAYRPGTGRRGEASFFLHDPAHEASRFHVRQLYLLRGVVLLLSLATVVAAYELARCLFPPNAALLVAGLCLFLPQFSFFSAKVHSDAVATLTSAVAYLLLVARATGRLGRMPTWVLLGGLMALAPLADREVYFLFLLIPIGLVAAERTLTRRLIAAAVIVTPALLFVRLFAFRRFGDDVQAWIGPLTSSYRGLWWNAEAFHYEVFEAIPKMFFGFVGWFNASILLPPWVYALFWDAGVLALCGFAIACASWISGSDEDEGGRRAAVAILAAGIVCNVLPIIYTNVLIVRSPDGRYFFPSLAAIIVVCLLGWRALVRQIHRDRRLPLTALAIAASCAAIVWLTGTSGWIAAGVTANHYGNQPHLLQTIRYAAFGLVLSPLVFAALARLRAGNRVRTAWPSRPPVPGSLFGPMPSAYRLLAAAAGLNMVLLLAFVRPLYTPLDAAEYAALIRSESREGDFSRAGAVARVAAEAYPEAAELRQLADELRFTTGDYVELQSYFAERLTHGPPLRTRAEYMALARTVRVRGWPDVKKLQMLVQHDAPADLGEGPALLGLEIDPSLRTDRAAGDAVMRAAHATPVRLGDSRSAPAFVEGFAVHEAGNGRCEIVVYYRPHTRWADRYVWLLIDPEGATPPARLDPHPPQFWPWEPGELAWDLFQTIEQRPFEMSIGVQIANNAGAPLRLARVERCVVVN